MKDNKNTYIGQWDSLYRVVLDTYFNGVTLTHSGDIYMAEKDSIRIISKSVVELERKMFQAEMDLR